MTKLSEVKEFFIDKLINNWTVSKKDATADVEELFELAADHTIAELMAEFRKCRYLLDELDLRAIAWEALCLLRLRKIADDPALFLKEKREAFLASPDTCASDQILYAEELPEDLQFALLADSELSDTPVLSDDVYYAMCRSFPNLETAPWMRLISLIHTEKFDEALETIPRLTRFSGEDGVYQKFAHVYSKTGQMEPLRSICHQSMHDYASHKTILRWKFAVIVLNYLTLAKGFSFPDRDAFEMAQKLSSSCPRMKWDKSRSEFMHSLIIIELNNAKVMRDREVEQTVFSIVQWVDTMLEEGCPVNENPFDSYIVDLVIETAKKLPDARFRGPFREMLDHFAKKSVLPKEQYQAIPSGYRSLESYAVHEDPRLSREMREFSIFIYPLYKEFNIADAAEALAILEENPSDERIIRRDYPYLNEILRKARKSVRAARKDASRLRFSDDGFPGAPATVEVFMPWMAEGAAGPAAAQRPGPAKGKKIGRNDPCPCGSGKKYKHCCGR